LRPDAGAGGSRRLGSGRLGNREDLGERDHRGVGEAKGGVGSKFESRRGFYDRRGDNDGYYDEYRGNRRDHSNERDQGRRGGQYDRDKRWGANDRDGYPRKGADLRGGRGGLTDRFEKRGGRSYGRRSDGDNEPEWMNVSIEQGEMMELRGFEDTPEKDQKNTRRREEMEAKTGEAKEKKPDVSETEGGGAKSAEFNFDDFTMNMDSIPGLADILNDEDDTVVGSSTGVGHGKSRFSQFFQNRPSEATEERPMSGQGQQQNNDDTHEQRNLLGRLFDRQQPSVSIPAESAYFAPISPAGKSTGNADALSNFLRTNNGKSFDCK